MYEGTWRMVCIGTGPGPKNVWAERVEDGANLCVPYSVWKRAMSKIGDIGVNTSQQTNREVRMDAQVQIMQVTVRNTSRGAVYDVACSDGVERQVWEAGLATALNQFAGTGQFVWIRFTHKQNHKNGKTYDNYSIQEFAPPGGQLPPDTAPQPMGGTPIMQQGAPIQQGGNTAPIQAAPQGGGDRFPPEVTTRITKLAAYDYAAAVIGGIYAGAGPEALAEATEALDVLAKHVYTQARSHEQVTQIVNTPQAVAEFANAQLPPGTVQVGTAVAAAQDASAEAPQAAPSDGVIDWN